MAAASDFSIGLGPTFSISPSGSDSSRGSGKDIHVAAILDRKWVIEGDYFTGQRLREIGRVVRPYPMVTLSRRWSSDPAVTRLPPFIQIGLAFKETQRCNTNSAKALQTIDCNPLVPSPVSIGIGLGFTTEHLEFLFKHTSNAGTSLPNYSQESAVLLYRF